MKKHDREVVLAIQGGSHMRNLNNENSDVDMKYFVLPTFDDLYEKKVHSKQTTSDEIDEDVQDVRRLETLFFKSNPAYLDLLFSPHIQTFGTGHANQIITMRDEIARMNLSNLYSASMGTMQQNIKDLQNPTSEKVAKLIERHAYNPKKAMLCVHLAKMLVKFYNNNFTNYKEAIWYEGDERDFMLRLKQGHYTFDQVKQFIKIAKEDASDLKELYKSNPVNEETNETLKAILRDLVRKNFLKNL
jgi:predicted nucleotidyltransferase